MIKLSDEDFKRLCDFMSSKYGINLTKKRVLIEYRLMNELSNYKINSFEEYLNLLNNDMTGNMEKELINRITTNYTFFMREETHFQYILDKILPAHTIKQPFHIWIAGCSSGQECYTLAMQLEDLRRSKALLPDITITATDISTKVLEQAKEATYPIEALETLPEAWRKSYCTISSDQKTFQLNSIITQQVTLQYHNLMDPFKPYQYHLIMCRNVMIYFDDISRTKILGHFHHSLKEKGYLILGHAEVIPYTNQKFHYHGSSIYQKKARLEYE